MNLGTTMPTWAPSTSAETQWLAFASLRDYGTVVTSGRADQLWIAANDPASRESGTDPSYSAFWVPFQDPAASNHRPFWTFNPDDECEAVGEVCDGFDNDCDGEIDEDCAPPECGEEVCEDRIDNDYDGEIDEDCECSGRDICDDGIDNDCDGVTDPPYPECEEP